MEEINAKSCSIAQISRLFHILSNNNSEYNFKLKHIKNMHNYIFSVIEDSINIFNCDRLIEELNNEIKHFNCFVFKYDKRLSKLYLNIIVDNENTRYDFLDNIIGYYNKQSIMQFIDIKYESILECYKHLNEYI